MKKNIKGKSRRRKGLSRSPYHKIETELYDKFADQSKVEGEFLHLGSALGPSKFLISTKKLIQLVGRPQTLQLPTIGGCVGFLKGETSGFVNTSVARKRRQMNVSLSLSIS